MLAARPSPGRSRFSKVLPLPPLEPLPPLDFGQSVHGESGQRANVKALPQPPLPLPPYLAVKMPSATVISRRPVGAGKNHGRDMSIASASSVYSDSPGMPGRDSEDSRHVRHSSVESLELDSVGARGDGHAEEVSKDQVDGAIKPQTRMHSNSNASSKSSTSRPEIWRRRSAHSDRSVPVFDLKLTKSNGFTESPPVIEHSSPPPERALPSIPKALPRSIGLPQNPASNRKPIPVRPAPPQPDTMGSTQSKFAKKPLPNRGLLAEETYAVKGSQQSSDTSGGTAVSGISAMVGSTETFPPFNAGFTGASNSLSVASSGGNLPHSRQPSGDFTVSSGPAVSNTTQPQKSQVAPILDFKSDIHIPSPAVSRTGPISVATDTRPSNRSVGPKTPLKISAPRINPFSSPDSGPKSASSLSAFKLNSPSSPDVVRGRASQPSKPDSSSFTATLPPPLAPPKHSLGSTSSQLSPLSASSASPNKSAFFSIPTGQSNSPHTSQPKYRSPFDRLRAAPKDMVQKAPAITAEQLDCFVSHRDLRTSRNEICSVGCMLCLTKDQEKRFACTFCHLRICETCVKGLTETPGRSVEHFLSRIGKTERIPQRPKLLDFE